MNSFQLTVSDLTIAGKSWGDPKNPPMVALHGWLDNANSFEAIAQYLQEDFYFVAIDLPGHGLSSHLPPACHYDVVDGLLMVMGILNALHPQPLHLLGHSMGACLASLLGGAATGRFLSLTLIEGLGPFSAPDDSACAQLRAYMDQLSKKTPVAKAYKTREDAALARAVKGEVSLAIASKLCERGVEQREQLYYWRHDRRLLLPSPLRMTEPQVLSCLRNINTKTCFIKGTTGHPCDTPIMQARMRAVKFLTVAQINGGHHLHMEEPKHTAQIITNYLKK